jgi:peptide/nickel transport system substrate-binding protein
MTTRPDVFEESLADRVLLERATRREFLIGSAVLGASLSAASLLAACGPGTQTSGGGSSPKRGGTANVAMAAFDPKSFLDPARSETDFDAIADGMMYDSLVFLDASFSAQPALALSWDVSPAADVWTFHLRSGVEFHDGSPFTAHDVAYNFNSILRHC